MADAPFCDWIGQLTYGVRRIGGLEELLAALAEGLRQGKGRSG